MDTQQPRPEGYLLLLSKFPWEDPNTRTIRLIVSGVDNGHAISLEGSFIRETRTEALELLKEVHSKLGNLKLDPSAEP